MTERQSPTPQWPGTDGEGAPQDAGLSLKPLFELLAVYRPIILATILAFVTLSLLAVLLAAAVLPTERTAKITVRMLFDGAADGRYPNRTAFSPAEIIATPVLSDVYRINDLQRFGPYDSFKDAMSVLHSSVEQDMLASFYGARLADTKLTPVERARLEDEFRKKREAIKDPLYAVAFRRSERFRVVPPDLQEKILNDTLATWARQADQLKGATHFNVPMFSRAVLASDLLDGDLLTAADTLRIQGQRAADVAEQLLQVPGAATIRTAGDPASLAEVHFAIRDVLRNQIEPAIYLIHERGLTTDRQTMVQFLHGQIVEARLERDAIQARVRVLQDALQGYMGSRGSRPAETPTGSAARGAAGLDTQALIPQINDSFLDRLLEMSMQTQTNDVEYRQKLTDRIIREGEALAELNRSAAFYEDLERTARAGTSVGQPSDTQAVKATLKRAFDSLGAALDRLSTLYNELSNQRLNPATTLYTVAEPFAIDTRRAVTWTTAGLALSLALLAGIVIAPIGCAIHAVAIRRSRPR